MKRGVAIFAGMAGIAVFTGCDTLETEAEIPASAEVVPVAIGRTGQVETGSMSWYSVKTNGGGRTASGEKLTNHGHTAAHRTLPFGTMVEVTNLKNNRSEVVRIIDRGPFVRGRIIDVSIGVAEKLDFVGNGVAPCRIEVLDSE